MDWRAVARDFHNDEALIVQVELSREVSDEEAAAAVTDAVPGVIFRSARWIRRTVREIAATALALQSAVAFCAMMLAVLGVGNIIMAGIHGRRFEYGVMRAVGASRGVLVRLVSAEAVLLAVAGAITGTALGMHLAWATTAQYRDLAGLRLSVPLPVWPTAAGWLAVTAMTVLAAAPVMAVLVRRPPAALVAAGRAG
jgi:putative ABC transport system permease protein